MSFLNKIYNWFLGNYIKVIVFLTILIAIYGVYLYFFFINQKKDQTSGDLFMNFYNTYSDLSFNEQLYKDTFDQISQIDDSSIYIVMLKSINAKEFVKNEDLDKALIELSNAREILNSKNQNFSFLKEIINLRMANIFIVLEDLESAKNILEVPFSTNLVNKLILQGDILMKENNFIDGEIVDSDYSNLVSTVKGMMAANIHEMHPLACIDMLSENHLDDLTVEELVSVLSIFTPIRISEEEAYVDVSHTNVNDTIKHTVKLWKKQLNKYYDIETKYQTNFTDSYDIHYDMCEFMYKWCFAEKDAQCRVIYEEAKQYNIYMGEFVKAILKIVNICNELEKAAIVQENMKLTHTLSLVRDKVLKSVATNQSLYV